MRLIFFFTIVLINFSLFSQNKEHTIKDGETLESIASLYGLTSDLIRNANSHVRFYDAGVILKIPETKPITGSYVKSSQKIQTKQAKKSSPQKNKLFEGVLLYNSDEFHNTAVRKMSNGTAYIGNRLTKVIIKNANMHISDESTHLHTIIRMEEGNVYIFSDLTNEGVVMPLKSYSIFCHSLDLEYNGNDKTRISKSGEIDEVAPLIQLDDQNKFYEATIKTNDSGLVKSVFIVDQNISMPPIYRWWFFGYNPQGLISKYLISNTSALPMFMGQAKSLISGQLVEMENRKVDDNEVIPPSHIYFKKDEDNDLWGLQRKNNKALKQRKLTPKTIKEKEMRAKINNEWGFAEVWLDTDVKSSSVNELSLSAITEISNSFLNITENITNSNAKESEDTLITDDSTVSSENQMLSINDLIIKCEEDNYKILNNKNFTKKDGEYFVKYNNRLIFWLNDKMKNGQKYISKSEWNEKLDSHNAELDKKHRQLMKNMRTINDQIKKTADNQELRNYRSFAHTLQMYHDYGESAYYNYEKDLDYVKKLQKQMKEIRAKYNCKKSKMEDWDGIPVLK